MARLALFLFRDASDKGERPKMSDNSAPPAAQAATPPAATPPANGGQGAQANDQGETPGPVPYTRFKEVNDRYTTTAAELAKIKADQKAADDQKLAADNNWKTLAEQREAELKTERLNNARLRVISKTGLPADLADRLVGETEEDLQADAEKLMALVGKPAEPAPARAPGVPPSRGGQPARLDISKMTPAEIRENRGKLQAQAAR